MPFAGFVAVTGLVLTAGQPLGMSAALGDTACVVMNAERLPLGERRSPLDSVGFKTQSAEVRICYGRPSARGRQIMGGLVPFGELWRTGANEPTMIHTTAGLNIAGIQVPAGSYSLYAVPGENEWEVVINRSISQWGDIARYTDEVRAEEVGRAMVRVSETEEHVETFTIRTTTTDERMFVLLEWERTRVWIPIADQD